MVPGGGHGDSHSFFYFLQERLQCGHFDHMAGHKALKKFAGWSLAAWQTLQHNVCHFRRRGSGAIRDFMRDGNRSYLQGFHHKKCSPVCAPTGELVTQEGVSSSI